HLQGAFPVMGPRYALLQVIIRCKSSVLLFISHPQPGETPLSSPRLNFYSLQHNYAQGLILGGTPAATVDQDNRCQTPKTRFSSFPMSAKPMIKKVWWSTTSTSL